MKKFALIDTVAYTLAGGFNGSAVSFDNKLLNGLDRGRNKFILKVNSAGNTGWGKALTNRGGSYFDIPGMSADLLGNIYLCGIFNDTCHFDNYTIVEGSYREINPFLAKLASSTFIDDVQKSEDNILVYPNPTTGSLTIAVDNDDYDNLSVYDAIGRRVHQQPIAKQQKTTKLELGHLANGVYILRLSGKDKQLNRQVSVLK